MAIQVENLPKLEGVSVALAGKDVLLYVNYGVSATEMAPKWVLVGGQRNTPLDMDADAIDASDKTSDGWGAKQQGMKTWSVEQESLVKMGDVGFEVLRYAFLNSIPVHIMRRDINGNAVKGWCYVTKFSDDNPHDDIASATITLTGYGKPVFSEEEPDPNAA